LAHDFLKLEGLTARLRTPSGEDVRQLLQATSESLADLRRFPASMLWALMEPTEAGTLQFCRDAQTAAELRKDFSFVVEDLATGEILGCAGLHKYDSRTPKGGQ
jgi:RimJ/RimL family protein N-acetyltransferase